MINKVRAIKDAKITVSNEESRNAQIDLAKGEEYEVELYANDDEGNILMLEFILDDAIQSIDFEESDMNFSDYFEISDGDLIIGEEEEE